DEFKKTRTYQQLQQRFEQDDRSNLDEIE
ncbi:MAG TPA: nicotinamide-nucleotide adenylyltransferase, partial [Acinetobacter nosocomialis]|nr:nicotinamide-nucleotide adenylyltransferase [Acinetobacter nosocomialis]